MAGFRDAAPFGGERASTERLSQLDAMLLFIAARRQIVPGQVAIGQQLKRPATFETDDMVVVDRDRGRIGVWRRTALDRLLRPGSQRGGQATQGADDVIGRRRMVGERDTGELTRQFKQCWSHSASCISSADASPSAKSP